MSETETRFRLTVPKDLRGPKGIDSQPVNDVKWISRDQITANDWNPNKVAPPELRLLKISLLEDGWTQPLVVRRTGENTYELVDGYHRWLVSEEKRILAMTDGFVPCAILPDKPVEQLMMSTIRHNRARGNHAVVKMADIALEMSSAGVSDDRICQLLQMEPEEIERLKARGNMVKRGSADDFGKGWQPA